MRSHTVAAVLAVSLGFGGACALNSTGAAYYGGGGGGGGEPQQASSSSSHASSGSTGPSVTVTVGTGAGAPACDDGVKNGTESDVDCGGDCKACAFGKACATAADCTVDCVGGRCVPRSGRAWEQRQTPPTLVGRESAVMAADATGVAMFGGLTTVFLANLWHWDGTTWSLLPTVNDGVSGPIGRFLSGMASDGTTAVLFGGWVGVLLGDTWTWSNGAWTYAASTLSPPARYDHAMAYDAVRKKVVLFGGSNNVTLRNDVWEFDITQREWTPVAAATTSPPGTYAMAMAFDGSRTILFGGNTAAGPSADTWAWNGSDWALVTPKSSPTARYGHSMTYDARRGRTILYGGVSTGIFDDTWEWDGTTWTESDAQPNYGGFYVPMAYDPVHSNTVMFLGFTGGIGSPNETWTYFDVAGLCAAAADCESGNCTDGVCCVDAACDPCSTCNGVATAGRCAPVSGCN